MLPLPGTVPKPHSAASKGGALFAPTHPRRPRTISTRQGNILKRAPPPMPQKFHLTLLIHAHQPCGNFDSVLESCYQKSYLPFVELLEKHPHVHAALHYSGPLLQWFENNRPEYFVKLRDLVQRGQIEM